MNTERLSPLQAAHKGTSLNGGARGAPFSSGGPIPESLRGIAAVRAFLALVPQQAAREAPDMGRQPGGQPQVRSVGRDLNTKHHTS